MQQKDLLVIADRPRKGSLTNPLLLPVNVEKAKAFLDAWVADGKVFLPEVTKPLSRRHQSRPNSCIYHHLLRHPSKECWALWSLVGNMVRKETLELPRSEDVLKDPHPLHNKDKGK